MIVGMDFGTTNSGMAVYDGKQLRLIPLDPLNANPSIARSALYITNDRAVHIGREAIETYYQQNLNRPSRYERVRVGEIELTFAELPSFIRDVYIERDVFSPGRLFLSFKTGLSSTTYLGTIVGSHYYFLEDIIALYLYVTRKRAEAYLETELDTIVLGRPVRYSDDATHNELARERLLQAAFRAGYKTVYLQFEPVAAAHYYETFIEREQNVLIFDFGGGTLDISILRLGDPKRREVLATGGIPVAGDVFDRKIVRAKMPLHFGEGGTYQADNKVLPIPSSYFEAFSNWQDLLMLQRNDRLERLRRIEHSASDPLKLRAFINLITSHYGLRMFDVAEAAKRRLSDETQTWLKFEGPGFSVRDLLTRTEFESLIRSEIRTIAGRLDAVVKEAGLAPDQIDAVIRTGGSSQIPAFIDLLKERFGAEKVHDIDLFGSVTSGLGILARQVETGDIALQAYRSETQRGGEYLNSKRQGGIPVIDLSLMRRLVDLQEGRAQAGEGAPFVMAATAEGGLAAAQIPQDETEVTLKALGLPATMRAPVEAVASDERVLLMTTEHRYLLKPARELADLHAAGMDFASLHGFQRDAFGQETVCALAQWSALQGASAILVLNTRGYARLVQGEALLNKLGQSVPYQMDKSRGYPAALLAAASEGEVVVVSHTGRAVRMPAGLLSALETRIMQLPPESAIIGAFYLGASHEIVVATAGGYAQRVLSSEIPETSEASSGLRLITRIEPIIARLYCPDSTLWALTTRRLTSVDQDAIPLLAPGETTSHKLLRLKKDERLVSLFYSNQPR